VIEAMAHSTVYLVEVPVAGEISRGEITKESTS
jgi:hypothetical protein